MSKTKTIKKTKKIKKTAIKKASNRKRDKASLSLIGLKGNKISRTTILLAHKDIITSMLKRNKKISFKDIFSSICKEDKRDLDSLPFNSAYVGTTTRANLITNFKGIRLLKSDIKPNKYGYIERV